jgi:arylsulfatase A-like enzyme
MGELLQAAGRRMLVVSSGSTGSAFLNNHMVAGGAILHAGFTSPPEFGEAMKAAIGPPPAEGAPPGAGDRYAVDAFLEIGIPKLDPSETMMWLGNLDGTAHEKGVGAPETVAMLRLVDGQIRRVQEGLDAAGLLGDYNIWVTSDHGFSMHTGGVDLEPILKPFAGTLPDGSPRIVASGGTIYVRDGDTSAVAGIVAALQRTTGVGAIFTRASEQGSFDGGVPAASPATAAPAPGTFTTRQSQPGRT